MTERIALVPDLVDGERVVLDVGDRRVVIINAGGEYQAFDAECPHRRGPLAEGIIRDGAIVCPWHWYAFSLRDGRCTNADEKDLPRFDVIERDGLREVHVGASPAELSWSERLRQHARVDPPAR